MPGKITKVYEGTDPGATPGRVFTASIGQEEIVQDGKFLDSLNLGLKGAISTGAVAIEDFAGVLSEYTVRVGSETRILATMRQLCALYKLFYGEVPFIWENTDATGNDFIGGVQVPIQAPADGAKPFTHAATRTAATNVGTETLAIHARWSDDPGGKKPIHAVAIGHTTAGSAGYETLGFRIAPVGKLVGLILQQVAPFADGDIDVSIQRINILEDGQRHSQMNALSCIGPRAGVSVGVLDPMDDLLKVFWSIDLRDIGGIEAKGKEITIQLDVQDVSDAVTILPVLEVA